MNHWPAHAEGSRPWGVVLLAYCGATAGGRSRLFGCSRCRLSVLSRYPGPRELGQAETGGGFVVFWRRASWPNYPLRKFATQLNRPL